MHAQPDRTPKKRSGGISRRVVAGFLLLAVVAIYTQSERIYRLFGPPRVTLAEAYAVKADGPTVDHGQLDALLRRHVDPGGWVDYPGLADDATQLDAYLTTVRHAPLEEIGRNERLGLLINAYNAFTLRLILDHWNDGQLQSIKDIPSSERWDAVRWNVGGHLWSLNQIEHEQIRPNFREPRIHFALVCAAVGCPPLRSEAYTAGRLEEQLADQAKFLHTHDRWLRYERGADEVFLTQLYRWYGDDFTQVAGSVLGHVARFSAPMRGALDADQPPRIHWLDYDWRLNRKENAGR